MYIIYLVQQFLPTDHENKNDRAKAKTQTSKTIPVFPWNYATQLYLLVKLTGDGAIDS
jgi:hypothetical protein